ncbi:MAG: magnesium transporter CorA family protein [Bacteroidales bacterium]|jgi:magnesium transporter|nr:magnesium transporter CorA family protein [Bacteroidales bacterium]
MIETIKMGALKWHHVLNPTEDDLIYLKDNFHFHPLDIDDCKSLINQRPKIDVYDDYYFLILHFPYFDKSNTFIRTREEKIFWGTDYIITLGKAQWVVSELFRNIKSKVEKREELDFGTSDALLYRVLEHLMKESYLLLRKIGDHVDNAGRDLFDKRALNTIELISITRKNLILLNTIFKPQLPVFNKFESGEIEGFAENMEEYWGNILDYYQKMWDLIEDYSELIEGYSKTFDSLQANRTNEIIKTLTLVSAIILPLTFITGLYGMNIFLPLQAHPYAFIYVIMTMVGIALLMLVFFKRKRWM